MSINVNIEVARAVPQLNNEGLTLVIFKNALAKTTNTENPVRVNTLDELAAAFQLPTTITQFRELYAAEYLIRSGVNLLCYTVDTPGTVASGDITNISDLEILDYKFIVVPYSFVSYAVDTLTWDSQLQTLVDDNDIELYLDFSPFITTANASLAIADENAPSSSKIELFVNSGFTNFTSQFALPSGLDSTSEATLAVSGEYASATDFTGIPSSLATVARKAKLLALETPWIPVAGEDTGTIPEFITLLRSISTVEKEAFQALNVNVLISRIGVGNLFVSQNTMYVTEDLTSPLLRSHVITEALWLKRKLKKIAASMLFQPNNKKSWDTVSLKVKSLFKPVLDSYGITSFNVYVGKGITMTDADIIAGLLKLTVNYVPIRVIENVDINITIKESESTYDIILAGGEL